MLLIIDSSLHQHNWAFVILTVCGTVVDCGFLHIMVYFHKIFFISHNIKNFMELIMKQVSFRDKWIMLAAMREQNNSLKLYKEGIGKNSIMKAEKLGEI